MVSVWLLAKGCEYILKSYGFDNIHVQICLDVQNIDRMGRAWLLECDTIGSEFCSSLENDNTILYSYGPREEPPIKYTIRVVQPPQPNYGQKTADAFIVLLDEEGKPRTHNTLYFFDTENPDNTSCSYLGETLDNFKYLH